MDGFTVGEVGVGVEVCRGVMRHAVMSSMDDGFRAFLYIRDATRTVRLFHILLLFSLLLLYEKETFFFYSTDAQIIFLSLF